MTLEVRVKSVDQESPHAYPSRSVEITTGTGRVATPSRAATLYEYNKKASVPTNIPIDNDVSLAVKRPNAATLAWFLGKNGVGRRWGREMKGAAGRMSYSALSAYLVQPTTAGARAPKKGGRRGGRTPAAPSGIGYLGSSPSKMERFLRILLHLQIDAGLDIVAVPYLGLPLSAYKETAKSVARAAGAAGAEPMFAFDLEYQKGGRGFEEAMSFFVRDVGARLVAFPGRPYTSAPASYDVLAGYAESDVAFVSFDTERSYPGSNPLSMMHSLPFIGTDIYAVKASRFVPGAAGGRPGGGGGGAATAAALDGVKFFDPSSLTIRPSGERLGDPAALLGEIGEQDNAWLRGILEECESVEGGQAKIDVLASVSKVHELKASTAEFGNLRGRISRGEAEAYVKEKPQLESTLAELGRRRKKR